MSERYLQRSLEVYRNALTIYPKIFMFHATLRFPKNHPVLTEGVMSAFIRSLKNRVQRNIARRRLRVTRVHDTDVHYVWCREVSGEHREHYHVIVMVNANTYRALGDFNESIRDHLTGMVSRAWASAIGVGLDKSKGLAHFSGDVELITTRQIPSLLKDSKYCGVTNSYEAGFFWLSYLCKLTTKEYGDGMRNFGYSKKRDRR